VDEEKKVKIIAKRYARCVANYVQSKRITSANCYRRILQYDSRANCNTPIIVLYTKNVWY